ncbi:MAG: hypothetical protein WCS65_16435 [Verrucomicrobiae bacterium]
MILASSNMQELDARVQSFLATSTPASARLIEDALVSMAANGVAR